MLQECRICRSPTVCQLRSSSTSLGAGYRPTDEDAGFGMTPDFLSFIIFLASCFLRLAVFHDYSLSIFRSRNFAGNFYLTQPCFISSTRFPFRLTAFSCFTQHSKSANETDSFHLPSLPVVSSSPHVTNKTQMGSTSRRRINRSAAWFKRFSGGMVLESILGLVEQFGISRLFARNTQ